MFVEAAAARLVRLGRVRVAVAEHEGPAFEGGLQDLRDVLAAVRLQEQPFGRGLEVAVSDVHQDVPDLAADVGAAGLARLEDFPPGRSRASAARASCVDLPQPSTPSNVTNGMDAENNSSNNHANISVCRTVAPKTWNSRTQPRLPGPRESPP